MKIAYLALPALALLAAACGNNAATDRAASTPSVRPSPVVITTPPSTSAPVRGTESWGGTGVFSVGATPSRGLKAAIPPGRYRIELDDPKLGAVAVTRCSDVPCSAAQNYLGGDSGFGENYVSVIDILGTDGAVRLDNAKLTPISE